jgi:hypothetical protein
VAEKLEHINSVVGAAAVEHDVFDRGAGLRVATLSSVRIAPD